MSKLFSALRIGELELAHRLVTTLRGDLEIDISGYRRRATAGGLVIAESNSEQARARWQQISDAIHEVGGLAVALLTVGSRHGQAADIDVDAVIDDVQRAARCACVAGFDGVEIDAAEGSLPDRFLQPQMNARDDDYGGDAQRRMRLLLEVAHVAAEESSTERVGIRLSPCAHDGQIELFSDVMRELSERELAYVHLANVNARSGSLSAAADRQAFRSDVSCALIASDYVDVDVAASVVERRWADAVGFLQVNDEPDFIRGLVDQQRRSSNQ